MRGHRQRPAAGDGPDLEARVRRQPHDGPRLQTQRPLLEVAGRQRRGQQEGRRRRFFHQTHFRSQK